MVEPQDAPADRRNINIGPPTGERERRGGRDRRHLTKSGLVATDAMKVSCPFCGSSESAVARSVGLLETEGIRRRRECASCGQRFPTLETVDYAALTREGYHLTTADDRHP